ncbi:MAG: DUF6516 family protein [Acidobacteria bacterium]|nr:DUF6516 family protein [Acidobacteriota bacterium]
MPVRLLYRLRREYEDGAILEMVIWRVSKPVAGSLHPYRYRLFYGYPGWRVVGYDNERSKGDYRHRHGLQEAYRFESPEALIDDFLRDVLEERGG